ncbi:Uncharacterized iron-regulated protein [Cribrihabitans marinus]|uniref:Uncharacterized iron-regulated protein n=1 Tax=Cribrihabitans marinus TaxID=1227549 RepID=A0A1H7CR86_9RHOB|nr:ChaN family lipoprotein [Cribrihabitans marinus]SEJ89672.1 Uncharacterized iron-regulated protein [Cribrihabitans marinus]
MRRSIPLVVAVLCSATLALHAAADEPALPDEVLAGMEAADVILLGEVHDNPHHHKMQAAAVAALSPRAVVWEMLTEEAATRVNRKLISEPKKMAKMLRWPELGWPPLALYLPIFEASPDAPLYGALVPREAARAAMKAGPASALGADAARFGLTIPLPPEEQAAREADQQSAHCNALPPEILPQIVQMQRLRDAVLTRAILRAVEEQGTPVVVITGNGHARKDRGIPTFLARMAPNLRVFALGLSETGATISGEFDAVLNAPAPERENPCAAFG